MSDAKMLDEKLAAVRSRWVLRDGVWAASRAALILVPVVIALGWLDYQLHFSRSVRVVELIALAALIVWILRRFVRPVMRRRRDTRAAALCVESAFDRFGGRLVSRVQFRGGVGVAGLSPALVEAACERVEREAAALPLSEAIDLRPVRGPAVGAAVMLVLLASVVAARPGPAGLWLRRTLLPFSEASWPQRTQLVGLEPRYHVRRGDPLEIGGRATGVVPRSGEVRWQTAEAGGLFGGETRYESFDIAADGTFHATIGPLLESITLTVEAGDAEATGIEVEVVIPPELAAVEAVYHYPEYTGRSPDTVQSGDIRAIIGTRVALRFTADRPVERMELAVKSEAGDDVRAVELSSATEGSAEIRVRERGRYEVRLFDRYGFTSDAPATFVIDPIEDRVPTVTIGRPAAEHTVTPATQLGVVFEAEDDFGVTGAVIRWQRRRSGGGERERGRGGEGEIERRRDGETAGSSQGDGTLRRESAIRKPLSAMSPLSPSPPRPISPSASNETGYDIRAQAIPLIAPQRRWAGRYTWDLAGADVLPGDEIAYHLEVHDAGEHPAEPKVGTSAAHVLKVVDPETLRQSLEARVREAYGELDRLCAEQTAGLDGVSTAMVSLPIEREGPVDAELRRLEAERNRQTRIRRQVLRVSERVREIAGEMGDSFLADRERIEALEGLAEGLSRVGAEPMLGVIDDLQRARAAIAEHASTRPSEEK